MKVLGIETSGNSGGVTICEDKHIVITKDFGGMQHGKELVLTIKSVFREIGWTPKDIDLIAVDVGPGSYTGLRVGVTCAKTMAYALHKGDRWEGAGVTIKAHNAHVAAGSTISADGLGYLGGLGPGAGGSDALRHPGGGGGYGGIGAPGGDGVNAGGTTYGAAFAPVDLGSGGGVASSTAGSGGGAITLEVTGTLTLDGAITANGASGGSVGCSLAASGGGSGGSIFVTTATLAGSGTMVADGGTGGVARCSGPGDDGGGGAGGRIAVLYAVDDGFAGFTTSSVSGGVGGGRTAPPGTMAFLNTTTKAPAPGPPTHPEPEPRRPA